MHVPISTHDSQVKEGKADSTIDLLLTHDELKDPSGAPL